MRVMVTGASGFLGKNIVRNLNNAGHEALAVTTNPDAFFQNLRGKVILQPFYEISNREISGLDAVIHQAAIIRGSSEEETLKINAQLPLEFFRRAIEHGCKKIVYASSTAVYGNGKIPFTEDLSKHPVDAYGLSKLNLEKGAQQLSVEFPNARLVGLRYPNVYGPGEGHKPKPSPVFRFAQQILDGNLILSEVDYQRDLLYIDDAVRATIKALDSPVSQALNCGTGQPVRYTTLVDLLNYQLGTDVQSVFSGRPDYSKEQVHVSCDMTYASRFLGLPKITIQEGIKLYDESGFLRGNGNDEQ